MDELILKELKEIKSLLQVIVSNQEQAGIQEINEYDDPIDIPLFVPGPPFLRGGGIGSDSSGKHKMVIKTP